MCRRPTAVFPRIECSGSPGLAGAECPGLPQPKNRETCAIRTRIAVVASPGPMRAEPPLSRAFRFAGLRLARRRANGSNPVAHEVAHARGSKQRQTDRAGAGRPDTRTDRCDRQRGQLVTHGWRWRRWRDPSSGRARDSRSVQGHPPTTGPAPHRRGGGHARGPAAGSTRHSHRWTDYRDGRQGEADLLARCHRASIRLAEELGLASLAFPAISTGIYGYPLHLAAPVALKAVAENLPDCESLILVRFVLFGHDALEAFQAAAREICDMKD